MGKSTAGSLLAARGIPVVDTDEIAREESQPRTEGFTEIVTAFGAGILSDEGTIDRRRLAARVFSDPGERRRLEAILHPRIERCWRREVELSKARGFILVAVLIPLLFERQYERSFGRIIAVACSRETQRSRLLARGWSDREIEDRNAAQIPVPEKMQRADFVVWTEGDLGSHGRQLDRILGRLSPR